jgi:hypothetical protein
MSPQHSPQNHLGRFARTDDHLLLELEALGDAQLGHGADLAQVNVCGVGSEDNTNLTGLTRPGRGWSATHQVRHLIGPRNAPHEAW